MAQISQLCGHYLGLYWPIWPYHGPYVPKTLNICRVFSAYSLRPLGLANIVGIPTILGSKEPNMGLYRGP